MNCSCRTSSLRIFVQTLTQVRLSASRPAYPIWPAPASSHRSTDQARLLSTASVASKKPPSRSRLYALQKSHSAALAHESAYRLDGFGGFQEPIDTTVGSGDGQNVITVNLDEAKSEGAVLDFSSEAIDSLAATVQRGPRRRSSPPSSPVDTEFNPRQRRAPKQELSGGSRLKRSKIMPSNSKTFDEEDDAPPFRREQWQIQKKALKEKFPEGWAPRKKLSPDALDGIRALHTQYPEEYTTEVLAAKFQVSAEVVRRILKSKWQPSPEEEEDRQNRWFNRGKNIWTQLAELGTKPPQKWRREGVTRDPIFNQRRGPRTEYPYAPRWRATESKTEPNIERKTEDKVVAESTQRKLGGRLL